MNYYRILRTLLELTKNRDCNLLHTEKDGNEPKLDSYRLTFNITRESERK
jgi:hypothetical protein